VRVSHHRYDVPGWGVGEVTIADGVVLAHDLPGPAGPGLDGAVGADPGGLGGAPVHNNGFAPVRDDPVPRAPSADAVASNAQAGPAPPWGDASPSGVTLARKVAPDRAGFEPVLLAPVGGGGGRGGAAPRATAPVPSAGRGRAHAGATATAPAEARAQAHAQSQAETGSDPESRADSAAAALAKLVSDRVRAHLAGGATSYADVPLDLGWCTPFQRALAEALRDVPWGEIVSYGELAALAGRPGAARAAGTFCARNRFALLLPCHRVVSWDGIGGYGASGVGLKRRLLALEGVEL
jgi:methylated-DNA-[protein]-cysteine S-methyltransferase